MIHYKCSSLQEYKEEYDSFLNHIKKEKQRRIKKYKNIVTKRQSILGEILLKELLLEKYHIHYEDCLIKTNFYGKPYITNYSLYYSISHSHDYVIVAISDKEIGIDIEKIRKTALKPMHIFATKKEQEQIKKRKNKEKEYWTLYTLKESYIKMIGKDFTELQNIEFNINNKKHTCNHQNIICNTLYLIPDYCISYCEKKL